MNEAYFEAHDAAANWNWENLLQRIREGRIVHLDLSDHQAENYLLTNEMQMRAMRDRLVEALEVWARVQAENPTFYWLELDSLIFGNKFFAGMDEQRQRRFFRTIFALPVCTISLGETSKNDTEKPAITICALALLDDLATLNLSVQRIRVGNFALSTQSQVQALANLVIAKRETLFFVSLEGIECPVNYNKRDRDGRIGFLDPLLYASSRVEHLEWCTVSTRMLPFQSSLVSSKAVRYLFRAIRQRTLNSQVSLCGLGVDDSHCLAIAQELRTSTSLMGDLSLAGNAAISDQGYNALLGLINRVNAIEAFYFDNKAWEGKLNLVSEMNRRHGRLEYLTNGHFTSDRRRWKWLEKLASLSSWNEPDAAKRVNYLWYELLEHPEFRQTMY
jgi:hypothetical protein